MGSEPVDNPFEQVADPAGEAGEFGVVDRLHRGDGIDCRDLAAAARHLLDDHVARQHRADLVLGLERLEGERGVAGAEDAVLPELGAELLLQRLRDIDLGDDAETGVLEYASRPLECGRIRKFGNVTLDITRTTYRMAGTEANRHEIPA